MGTWLQLGRAEGGPLWHAWPPAATSPPLGRAGQPPRSSRLVRSTQGVSDSVRDSVPPPPPRSAAAKRILVCLNVRSAWMVSFSPRSLGLTVHSTESVEQSTDLSYRTDP